jgi:short subunit dehydrogenase-like uncharacterized protein
MWMIYGAYGFSGTLIAEAAVQRGHRPVLAGRSEAKLRPLAERLGLDYRVISLDDLGALTAALKDVDLVLHAAGPFIYTAEPMMRACSLTGTHYLDITGEIIVIENSFVYDEAARQNGCVVMCGVGFDVVPTSCLGQYVADQLPDATHLDIAFRGLTTASSGTAKSAVANGAAGGWVRRNGTLVAQPLGAGARIVRFPSGESAAIPIPWGDLTTAYRATGIPNITTYMGIAKWTAPFVRVAAPLGQVLLAVQPAHGLLNTIADALFKGPTEQQRTASYAELWAQARNAAGDSVEAWLQTPEPYQFTGLAAVQAVERALAENPSGTLTPAQVFGADFPLEIARVQRWDQLP